MWLLILVSFTNMAQPPLPVAQFPSSDACQVAAVAINKQTMNGAVKGEPKRPGGSVFVCFRMEYPA